MRSLPQVVGYDYLVLECDDGLYAAASGNDPTREISVPVTPVKCLTRRCCAPYECRIE